MTKSELVHKVEACIPKSLVSAYREGKRFYYWKRQQLAYRNAVQRVQKKQGSLNVIFLVQYASVWKYDSVFQVMQNDPIFCPIIFVCPLIDLPKDEMLYQLQQVETYFLKKGYNVYKGYNENENSFTRVEDLQPDIVFYSSLWSSHTLLQYDEYHLRSILKCYVNYGFCSIAEEWGVASRFHGLMWRNFSECEALKNWALQVNPLEMRNTIVTGYPIYDEYQSCKGLPTAWKNADKKYKRIIWAPHHTIAGRDGILKFSTFLENADLMLRLADKYKDKVQFVFKPHPQLIDGLYSHSDWGKERTDAYYKKWAEGENTALVTGSYMDLFKSSDAMIHDCGSFIVEYLYTQKPVMYLAYTNRDNQSNEVGKWAYACHYHGATAKDIERFIDDVVLNGQDSMAEKRRQFYDDILLPPNGMSVAENIISEIKKELKR